MRFDIITLFPGIITSYTQEGMVGKAVGKGVVEVFTHDLRAFGEGNYRQVDDRPFGGGAGMVLMFEPMQRCLEAIKKDYQKLGIKRFEIAATTAGGQLFKQSVAKSYASRFQAKELEAMVIICGRYEGFDQRILEKLVDSEISIGNFVLTGGELVALAVVDAVTRLMPGVLNKEESFTHDSFYEDDTTVQFPQYTRPEIINYDGEELPVPPVLLSGNHADIEKWRRSKNT